MHVKIKIHLPSKIFTCPGQPGSRFVRTWTDSDQQCDQSPHCLPFHLHLLDTLPDMLSVTVFSDSLVFALKMVFTRCRSKMGSFEEMVGECKYSEMPVAWRQIALSLQALR